MAEWVQFAAVKRGVSLEAVLRQYGVMQGLRRSGKDRYRGRCPIHQGEGRETFHVDLAKNVFHCFSCGAGGTVLDLVAALEKCAVRQAALRLASGRALPCGLGSGAPAGAWGEKQLVTKKIEDPGPLHFVLRGMDGRHPYLGMRGIEEATAAVFGVGFYGGPGRMHGRVVIPIHNARGQLVAYCGRSLDGTGPRYQFPAGFPKSRVLFNLHRAVATGERKVIVVEGFFDCMKVHQAGFHTVVALMGAALYERQQELLRERFGEVVLMLDGDEAGRRAMAAAVARLGSCSVRVIELAKNTQPDQLPAEVIQQLLGPGAANQANERRKPTSS